MDDDADVFRCVLSLLIDLRSRYEDPRVFVNDILFTPTDEQVFDYEEYLRTVGDRKKVKKPPLPVRCMSRYAVDEEAHREEVREREERRFEAPPPAPVAPPKFKGKKVKVK
jgi:hypothetical protein